MSGPRSRVFLVALGIVAIVLSGCEVRQGIEFNEDGSGTFTYLVGLDKDILDDLGVGSPYERVKEQVEERDFPVELEPYETSDLSGFRLSFEFESVDDLKEKLSVGEDQEGQQTIQELDLEMGDGGWELTGAVGAPGLGSGEGMPIDVSELEERLDMQFSISMPGALGDSNADTVTEDEEKGTTTFVWILTPGRSGEVIEASTALPSAFPILLVVGAGLGVLLFGAAVWMLMRRRSPVPVLEQ